MATETDTAHTFYLCSNCGQLFVSSWSDVEAMREYKKNFPKEFEQGVENVVVCDDCYSELIDAHPKTTEIDRKN